jgi:hypothetical protein
MKLRYLANKRLNIEIDAESPKDAFKQLASFQEIFGEEQCGKCQSEELQFRVRTVEGNDYYELMCKGCFAKLSFGQHKVGNGLFPKRKLQDGSYDKESKGWHKWIPQEVAVPAP